MGLHDDPGGNGESESEVSEMGCGSKASDSDADGKIVLSWSKGRLGVKELVCITHSSYQSKTTEDASTQIRTPFSLTEVPSEGF